MCTSGLRSYQKTLQVRELQKGIPKDLNKTPSLNHVQKISKTTKPKNLASMRSSRASDGLSALCQLIASWRTPSLRRPSTSTTMAVRSNTQSINQSIQRLLLLLRLLLLQHYHHSTAGGTPSPHPPTCHVLLPQSALCRTPTSPLLPTISQTASTLAPAPASPRCSLPTDATRSPQW